MTGKTVLVFGSGHLAYRVKKLLQTNGFEIIYKTIEAINPEGGAGSLLENFNAYIGTTDMSLVVMVYLLDDRDDYNLQLIIALISLNVNIPITASLFNENIAPHLQAAQINLKILNPAKIAAPVFVAALYEPIERYLSYTPVVTENKVAEKRGDTLIRKLLFAFILLLVIAVVFFHIAEHLDWVDALYFVVVTVATVGYGDINLINSSVLSKLFAVALILTSTVFIWLIFSLTIDHLIKKRIQLALGRKKYNLKNHVVVCGLGRLGYFIVEELIKRKEKVIIIEQNEASPHISHFRHLGAEVYIGDARLPKVLFDVKIQDAQALISVISKDSVNLEIGLNARSFQPDVRLILRIFDELMAQKIKEHLDIHLTLSASAIADGKFYEAMKK